VNAGPLRHCRAQAVRRSSGRSPTTSCIASGSSAAEHHVRVLVVVMPIEQGYALDPGLPAAVASSGMELLDLRSMPASPRDVVRRLGTSIRKTAPNSSANSGPPAPPNPAAHAQTVPSPALPRPPTDRSPLPACSKSQWISSLREQFDGAVDHRIGTRPDEQEHRLAGESLRRHAKRAGRRLCRGATVDSVMCTANSLHRPRIRGPCPAASGWPAGLHSSRTSPRILAQLPLRKFLHQLPGPRRVGSAIRCNPPAHSPIARNA